MDKLTIIEKNGSKVLISVDLDILDQILEVIRSSEQQLNGNIESQSFLRRIVPFFMNQYLLWAIKCELKPVVKWLKMIKNSKKSKQHKFELGDLKILFQKQNLPKKCDQSITQRYWSEFLKNGAEESVFQNRKIKSLETKKKYINTIPVLLSELEKIFPYDKLLSKYRKNEDSDGLEGQQQSVSFESQSYFNDDYDDQLSLINQFSVQHDFSTINHFRN